MGAHRGEGPGMNKSLALVGGNRFSPADGRAVGLIGALSYNHRFDYFEGGLNNTGAVNQIGGGVELPRERADSRGVDELLLGLMAGVVVRPSADRELSLKLIYNHAAEDEARLQVQRFSDFEHELNQALHYTERDVVSAQLHGRSGPEDGGRGALRWYAAWNATRQAEPDVRFFRYRFDPSSLSGAMPLNSTPAQNTRRIFRRIGEGDWQGGFDVSLPFTRLVDARGSIKGGMYFQRSDRDYKQHSFSYRFINPVGNNPIVNADKAKAFFQGSEPDQLWTDVFNDPENIGLAPIRCAPGAPFVNCALPNQLLWIIEPVGVDVNYTGGQQIDAVYGMAELPLTRTMKAIFGVRLERTRLDVDPQTASGNVDVVEVQESGDRALVPATVAEAAADIAEQSFLPSIGLAWEAAKQMHLRGSFSRTIARPTFRELSPVATEEFIFGDEFIGNPDLSISRITNYDLRWEWFMRPGDVLAVSLFHKELEDPIELISFGVANRVFVQPVNFETGQVRGLELEARTALDPLAGWLRGVELGANFATIDSEVDIPQAEQDSLAPYGLDTRKRRLQGQPDLLGNLNLSYDNERLGLSTSVLYNYVGETLSTGAARGVEDGVPDAFERPSKTVDLSYKQEVARARTHLSVALRVRNLLRDEREVVFRTPDGQEAVKTLRDTSRRYSLAASFKW
jgi:TonB-dependent receptor